MSHPTDAGHQSTGGGEELCPTVDELTAALEERDAQLQQAMLIGQDLVRHVQDLDMRLIGCNDTIRALQSELDLVEEQAARHARATEYTIISLEQSNKHLTARVEAFEEKAARLAVEEEEVATSLNGSPQRAVDREHDRTLLQVAELQRLQSQCEIAARAASNALRLPLEVLVRWENDIRCEIEAQAAIECELLVERLDRIDDVHMHAHARSLDATPDPNSVSNSPQAIDIPHHVAPGGDDTRASVVPRLSLDNVNRGVSPAGELGTNSLRALTSARTETLKHLAFSARKAHNRSLTIAASTAVLTARSRARSSASPDAGAAKEPEHAFCAHDHHHTLAASYPTTPVLSPTSPKSSFAIRVARPPPLMATVETMTDPLDSLSPLELMDTSPKESQCAPDCIIM